MSYKITVSSDDCYEGTTCPINQSSNFQYFCTTVQNKVQENADAFTLLYDNQKYVTCVSLLRIQLDCYIRLLYLKNQPDETRNNLLEEFYRGSKWRITDREMLDTVSFYGWEKNVYKLSCSFIHLSRLSNIHDENVLDSLSEYDRNNIIDFINNYHDAALTTQATNHELIPYLPKVMQKITENLLFELNEGDN